MSAPTIDHRGPEFAALGRRGARGGSSRSSAPRGPVVVYPASGTGAWEAALVNTLSPGDRVLALRDRPLRHAVARDGRASRARRSTSCRATGATAPTPRSSRARSPPTRGRSAIKAVCVVHNETSTGVTSRVAEVRAAMDAAGHPALLLVDTISSLGSIDYRHDEWGVDVTVGCSQKGLMLPPGLGLQRRQREGARRVADRGAAARVLGLAADPRGQRRRLLSLHARRRTCSTACARRCDLLHAEGLGAVFARHARHAEARAPRVRGWGLEIVCARRSRALELADGRPRARTGTTPTRCAA